MNYNKPIKKYIDSLYLATASLLVLVGLYIGYNYIEHSLIIASSVSLSLIGLIIFFAFKRVKVINMIMPLVLSIALGILISWFYSYYSVELIWYNHIIGIVLVILLTTLFIVLENIISFNSRLLPIIVTILLIGTSLAVFIITKSNTLGLIMALYSFIALSITLSYHYLGTKLIYLPAAIAFSSVYIVALVIILLIISEGEAGEIIFLPFEGLGGGASTKNKPKL